MGEWVRPTDEERRIAELNAFKAAYDEIIIGGSQLEMMLSALEAFKACSVSVCKSNQALKERVKNEYTEAGTPNIHEHYIYNRSIVASAVFSKLISEDEPEGDPYSVAGDLISAFANVCSSMSAISFAGFQMGDEFGEGGSFDFGAVMDLICREYKIEDKGNG